jgi:hypothetical protein
MKEAVEKGVKRCYLNVEVHKCIRTSCPRYVSKYFAKTQII